MDDRTLLIVPSKSQFDYVKSTIFSIRRADPEIVIYLADDASDDRHILQTAEFWESDRVFCHLSIHEQPVGLTALWDEGLRFARSQGIKYTICGNSDILCPKGFLDPLKEACEVFDLVGPVSNAPGKTNPAAQSVTAHFPNYQLTDNLDYLDYVSQWLRSNKPRNCFIPSQVNGFFMMAKTESWWDGAFDNQHVFNPDPKYRIVGSEDELMRRWAPRKKFAIAPRSFVFHYRSVSRGEKVAHGLWMRRRIQP